jgi:fluoride exporter
MREMPFLLVFLGAGIGGALRQAVNVSAEKWFGLGFPIGTLTVNVFGSLIMGVFAAFFAFRTDLPHELKLFLTTGLLGGFTTFSTFSLDTVSLWERQGATTAVSYVVVSVFLSLTAVLAGMALVRLLHHFSFT